MAPSRFKAASNPNSSSPPITPHLSNRMSPVFLRSAVVVGALLFQPLLFSAVRSSLNRTNLLQWLDAKGKIHPVTSRNTWTKRRASILKAMQEVMGPLPGPEKKCPLDVKIEEEVDCGTYIRRFITYSSEPGSRVPAYLLIPNIALEGRKKVPGILCLHQTRAAGPKAVVGP